jgi:hypothetical protein
MGASFDPYLFGNTFDNLTGYGPWHEKDSRSAVSQPNEAT